MGESPSGSGGPDGAGCSATPSRRSSVRQRRVPGRSSRRRRLERARMELAAPLRRPGVAEVAARWQFADSSHFIRAFKNQYGQTPAEFARANGTSRETK
ncbi:helix-turn-helix domain-containing protein [Actinoallomurus vinaceus]